MQKRSNATIDWARSVGIQTLQAKVDEYEVRLPGCKPRDSEMVAEILSDLYCVLAERRAGCVTP